MPTRLFTLEEAEGMIPQLERSFERLDFLRQQVRHLLDQMGSATGTSPAEVAEEAVLRGRADFLVGEANRELEALSVQGVLVKDLERGLVDFLTSLEGRSVCLCWHRGESRINFWHEETEGFAGRKPLHMSSTFSD